MQPSYEEKKEKFSMIRKKPHHVPPHLHNAIELVYVTKGELELGIGYELYHMEEGDFAIVFPDLIHHYQVFSKGKNEVYQFYASLELSGPFMALLQKKCPENPVIASAGNTADYHEYQCDKLEIGDAFGYQRGEQAGYLGKENNIQGVFCCNLGGHGEEEEQDYQIDRTSADS